ncbi:MAG: hypothetical protein ACRC4H_01290 [Plesiomonas sp.]|uniref:hypothetical protein n=1 Tax=Plesiomonas sp. TaxID=2486279 RepID=UPI003EE7DFF6
MADKENYLVAIDILRCHLGKSYEEACEVLGLEQNPRYSHADNSDSACIVAAE